MGRNIDPIEDQKQRQALINLIEEISKLGRLVDQTISDQQTHERIESAQIELDAFKQILTDDAEYTEKQVEKLCKLMSKITNRLNDLPTSAGIIKQLDAYFTALNGGKSPIDNIAVDITFDKAFNQKMFAIQQQSEKVQACINTLRMHSGGRHYTLIERFTKACQSLLNSVSNLFHMAVGVAKDAKYLGDRIAIAVGLKEETDETKLEYTKRKREHFEHKEEELKQRIADKKAGEKLRQEAAESKRSKIFRK